MRLVLFQPEIAGNAGAAIRAAACFGAGVDIVEPCGFPPDDRALKRAAMDYGALAPPVRHAADVDLHDLQADLAGQAETQALRISIENPNLRILMTVTEGVYRIVARRSAGIETLADLRGKRIGAFANTSSAYFLHRMLRSAGMTEADIQFVDLRPRDMTAAILEGRVDAIAIWEPESERAHVGEARHEVGRENSDARVWKSRRNLPSLPSANWN